MSYHWTMNPNLVMFFFSFRPNGMVPCIAIGSNRIRGDPMNQPEECTGIAFQCISNGIIRPLLKVEDFTPINWPNSPTTPEEDMQPLEMDLQVPGEPSQSIQDFCAVVATVKARLLNEVINYWVGMHIVHISRLGVGHMNDNDLLRLR